jgi:hypothetical protein
MTGLPLHIFICLAVRLDPFRDLNCGMRPNDKAHAVERSLKKFLLYYYSS